MASSALWQSAIKGAAFAIAVVCGIGLIASHIPTTGAQDLSRANAGRPPQRVYHQDFVGAATCGRCHQAELKAWTGSHHHLAMQEANGSTVLGNFADASFEHAGVTSTFFKRGSDYFVRTEGPDGKLTDYKIAYTFGVTPLQQYLVAFPGGRLQTLPIAWDTRAKSEGGQRWFHLYPDQRIAADDQLHWTGLYQNWNMQCAECHSTNLRKNYDATASAYNTTFTEINVSCEACHGPGARHVAWAKDAKGSPSPDHSKGLSVRLSSRWQEAWRFPSGEAKVAERDQPVSESLMNVCSACHARRSTLVEEAPSGRTLENSHRLALLLPPNYYADGQQRDEVYTWGSFRQSKMFQRGVTCMDCHEPHALKLRAEGNGLCGNCHNANVFDTPKHHFHQEESKGAQCVNCHMPAQNYMVIDARRDHAIRVPRPDISAAVGSPDACTMCHKERNAQWASEAMDVWYGLKWRDRPTDALTLHQGATQGAKALPGLLKVVRDRSRSGIVRATALTLALPHIRAESYTQLTTLLSDSDPLVRIAALGLTEQLPPASRLSAAAPLLQDDIRAVRMEAARILADAPRTVFPDALGAAHVRALSEFVEALRLNADWPAENVNLGNLFARQERPAEARAAYERALSLDPRFVGAYVNLADLERQQGDDTRAEAVLRRGLAVLPSAADLRYSLGLTLVRRRSRSPALVELAQAATLAPDNARYAYVYAVALHSAGRRDEALSHLGDFNARHPHDIQVLNALVSMHREAGNHAQAQGFAKDLAVILPGDPNVVRLLKELERKQ